MRNVTDTKKIFFWNMTGSLISALSSVILFMLVTRFLDNADADIFSLAFSVSQMFITISSFQVRVFQSTDIIEKYSFKDYFHFRIFTCTLMLVTSIVYVAANGYTGEKALVVLLLGIFRIADAIADVYEGNFQQKERLDIAGKSLTYRFLTATVLFGISVWLTGSLIVGCIILIVVTFATILLYDHRMNKELFVLRSHDNEAKHIIHICKELFMKCFPIFLDGFLIIAIFNIPKTVIDKAITGGIMPEGHLAYYNIIFMPASTINLLFILLRPLITKMAILLKENKLKQMMDIICKMVLGVIGCTLVATAVCYLIGIPVLNLFCGKDISPFKTELIILVAAGGINTLATLCDNIITILRRQKYLVAAYIVSIIVTYVVCEPMLIEYGMLGAAFTFAISMICLFAISAVILITVLYSVVAKHRKQCPEMEKE